jgi:hypothetical protein
MTHVHFDRTGDRDLRAFILHRLPAHIRHAGHVDEQVVGTNRGVAGTALALGKLVKNRTDTERREDVCNDLQAELPPDRPRLLRSLRAEIDLTAHDHVDELVTRT